MITRMSGAIVGLLAFIGMLMAGYLAENPLDTILFRALIGLFCGFTLGYLAGRVSEVVAKESFTKLVEADADAELAEQRDEDQAASGKKQNNQSVGSSENKEDRENSRAYSSAQREKTVSARAAREVIGRP